MLPLLPVTYHASIVFSLPAHLRPGNLQGLRAARGKDLRFVRRYTYFVWLASTVSDGEKREDFN